MATLEVTSQDPILLTVDGSINSAGETVADLRPGAVLSSAGMTATGEALLTAANAAAVCTALGLGDYANDAAAQAGGVAVGQAYHTAGVLKTRMT